MHAWPLITDLIGLQWMPLDLLIQHVHRALKVIYSYRYYNYTDEHSILLKLPIAFGHHHAHLYHIGSISLC